MLFRFGKPHFLGIDFGTSSIKAVELAIEDGRPTLVNYGQVSLSILEKGVHDGRTYDEEIALHLRALLEKFHPKSPALSVAMPAFIGLISLIELPEMEESELQEAIKFEAHKYIPTPLEEVALSWEVAGKVSTRMTDGEQTGTKMEVLLVAALNKEVERYEHYVRATGLEMNLLELETFSIVRSVVGKTPGLVLVLDIGSRATNLILVEDGFVKVSRNLDVGGRDITRTLMEGLSITQERAESLKKSGKDFLNAPESALVFPVLQMVASEGKRMLDAYGAKHPGITCDAVLLSGGTGQFTGLSEYLSKAFALPVRVGDPWERVSYDEKLRPMIESLGTSFSVALGLALSGVEAELEKKDKKG